MIRQLAHINFATDQPQALVAFYTDVLGMGIAFTLDDAAGKPFGWYVDCGNRTFIEIFDQQGAARQWNWPVDELKPGTRFRHLSLEVVGMEPFCEEIRAKGAKVGTITVGMDGSKQAWLSDPDGNTIELMEYTHVSRQLR